MKIKVKRLLIEMLVGFLIFAVLTTVYSWFTNQRRLATVTRVNAPSALVIGAGFKESSMNINITSIYKAQTNVEVEGANGYTAIPYKVFIYEPAELSSTEVHQIKLA